ncbi:unnamed protein product [Aspergillus oryzae]|uniref:Unnamed protein product n=2 Tax=Aspergillus oryzae TaxID=5062 RepID=A0AAN4YJL5_ASPOZ|nr:unnamed protein product [Aspergillus oryzae]GMF93350.1 unnamed protein product [Aspergillus oryzae]GMG05564.1 unnamed protein product [Aspergillus oryzae]GMG28194.1 unnamed protein product [Aspergillus oryzae]GMG41344.1 unnamed protein product [Aspergillus oryzae var. brunneus]
MGLIRAGNITDDHLKKIKAVDKVRKDQRRQTVEGDISGYVTLLSGSADAKSVLDSASRRTDIVQYILVLAADLINALSSALIAHPDPYKPFLPLLRHSTNAEDPIPLLTSTFLTNLVSISLASSSKSAARDEEALPQLYTYLSSLTQNQDSGLQDIGVQELSALLRTSRSREIFWKQRGETVTPLIEILRAATGGKDTSSSTVAGSSRAIEPGLSGGVGLQLLYRVLLVIWQLSFEGALIGDDLQAYTLSDMLDEYTKTQTTFDQYAAELQSGHLRWSPPHRNPTFWKDNARRILDDANLPRKLAEIISKEWDNDKQVLAIACNDVGHLVKELPGRRAQLEKLGLKARVMELMADKDESVRWESLRAVGEWLRYTFDD